MSQAHPRSKPTEQHHFGESGDQPPISDNPDKSGSLAIPLAKAEEGGTGTPPVDLPDKTNDPALGTPLS